MTRNLALRLSVMFGLGFISSFLWGESLIVQPESKIAFSAVGKPGFIRISGEGAEASGRLQYDNASLSGDILFAIKSISTGIDMRDSHLKEKYLEIAKFPEAKLTFVNLKIPSLEEKELKWTGKLSLHGKEHEVSGEAELHCKDFKPCEVKTSFPIMLEDFAVDIPTYAGITVAKKVDIEVTIVFKKDDTVAPKDKQ